MLHRSIRSSSLFASLAVGALAASCGGGSSGAPEMVLVSFNLPNIAGVTLNTPLVYTFSDNVDPTSVTPDTIQVVGTPSFTFESIVVDGNLVAELPFIPNFDSYSDSGMAPGKLYSVFLPIFPAVDTVRSTSGRPLVKAASFNFTTIPTFTFSEVRRPLIHAPGPVSGPNAKGDEDGCLNNATNGLYVFPGTQFGSGFDARLLCLKNEGAPHILNDPTNLSQSSNPFHDKRAVGTASATSPGSLDLGAIRIRFNEPLDPISVTPYVPTTRLSLNVQLWRVGDGDAIPLPIPLQIPTTKPTVVQNLTKTEVILVPTAPPPPAAQESAQPQGTYLINIQGVRDLAGNLVVTSDRPNPVPGGYAAIETAISGKIAPGYRIYFRTLELPSTPNSITESFGNNVSEKVNALFTFSIPGGGAANLTQAILLPTVSPAAGGAGYTLTQSEPGQATVANWNGAYRFLDNPTAAGMPDVRANTAIDNGAGRLKAVFRPYLGNGDDLAFNAAPGSSSFLSSDGGDLNNDGVYEFTSFTLPATATLTLLGSRPILVLVKGACVINGTINGNGLKGNPGIDTDGTSKYTFIGPSGEALRSSGVGGLPGPGGGNGGNGAPAAAGTGLGTAGSAGVNIFGIATTTGAGDFGTGGDVGVVRGGGGGGYGANGSPAVGNVTGFGALSGSADFTRGLGSFSPERCFQPSANVAGGAGGGGGGVEDDNGANETSNNSVLTNSSTPLLITTGDDGGAGGGGGGGAFWVIADTISVGDGVTVGSGQIHCDGARGGNTYSALGQVDAGTFISGVVNDADTTAANLGSGGGGGGGSGGAILLQARTSLTIASTAVLTVAGGAGGSSKGGVNIGNATVGTAGSGGAGGVGRIALMTFAGSTDSAAAAAPVIAGGASLTPAPGVASASYRPTVDLTSQGVSHWLDFVTAITTFSAPFWDDNFLTLTGVGLQQGAGLDFNAVLEFQGADSLVGTSFAATAGTGVTAWTASLPSLNNKVFVRWRWRFFVNRAGVGPLPDFNQSAHPMPQVLNFTIPFAK